MSKIHFRWLVNAGYRFKKLDEDEKKEMTQKEKEDEELLLKDIDKAFSKYVSLEFAPDPPKTEEEEKELLDKFKKYRDELFLKWRKE